MHVTMPVVARYDPVTDAVIFSGASAHPADGEVSPNPQTPLDI